MRKLIIWISVLLFVVLTGCFFGSTLEFSEKDAEGKENLVFNADFEGGDFKYDEVPLGWMILHKTKPEAVITWDNNVAYSGEKSACITVDNSEVSLISEAFDINFQYAYYNRLFMKSDKWIGDGITCYFVTFDDKGKIRNEISQKTSLQTEWSKLEFSTGFFKKEAKYARIVINFDVKGKRKIWVDDVGSFNVYQFTTK